MKSSLYPKHYSVTKLDSWLYPLGIGCSYLSSLVSDPAVVLAVLFWFPALSSLLPGQKFWPWPWLQGPQFPTLSALTCIQLGLPLRKGIGCCFILFCIVVEIQHSLKIFNHSLQNILSCIFPWRSWNLSTCLVTVAVWAVSVALFPLCVSVMVYLCIIRWHLERE